MTYLAEKDSSFLRRSWQMQIGIFFMFWGKLNHKRSEIRTSLETHMQDDLVTDSQTHSSVKIYVVLLYQFIKSSSHKINKFKIIIKNSKSLISGSLYCECDRCPYLVTTCFLLSHINRIRYYALFFYSSLVAKCTVTCYSSLYTFILQKCYSYKCEFVSFFLK